MQIKTNSKNTPKWYGSWWIHSFFLIKSTHIPKRSLHKLFPVLKFPNRRKKTYHESLKIYWKWFVYCCWSSFQLDLLVCYFLLVFSFGLFSFSNVHASCQRSWAARYFCIFQTLNESDTISHFCMVPHGLCVSAVSCAHTIRSSFISN